MSGAAASGGRPDLEWLAGVLWGPAAKLVRAGRGSSDAEAYAVLPGRRHPRILVPLGRGRAARVAAGNYRALRRPAIRAARAGLGFLLGSGAMDRLALDRLVVRDPTRSVVVRIREVLGRDDLDMIVGIGRAGADRKPVLEVFDAAGRPVAFVKVGWNAFTSGLVRNEAERLAAWGARGTERIGVPRLLHHEAWNGLALSFAEPIPIAAGRHRRADRLPPPWATQEIAGLDGRSTEPLAGGSYWRRTREHLEAMAGEGQDRGLAATIRRAGDAIESRHADTVLEFGTWHGNWTPWNLAWHGGRLWSLDWEHSGPGIPVGLDLAWWQIETALRLENLPVVEAARRAREIPRGHLDGMAVGPAAASALADLVLVELALRTASARTAGARIDPRVWPAVVEVMGGATG